jgi:Spy/CpxP family protein refolding chaperone
MKPHLRTGLVIAALLVVVCWLHQSSTSPDRSPDGTVQAQSITSSDHPAPWPAFMHDHSDEESVRTLKLQEDQRQKAEYARARMMRERSTLQRIHQADWTAVLQTNWAKFEELRKRAAAGDGRTPCTLCDGFGYMPCVMCTDHNGRCVNCDGISRSVNGQHCAACLGSGKCYLCNGHGKMLCIFCNDGRIEVDWHMPHSAPPLE